MLKLKDILNYIKGIFMKPKMLDTAKKQENNIPKNNTINSIKKGGKDFINKRKILKEIDKNPELIDTLPYARLVELNKIYEERIKELKTEINQLL